jgi:hypothetical protein
MGLIFVASVSHIATMDCSLLGSAYHLDERIKTFYFRHVLYAPPPPVSSQNKEL